MLPGGTTTSIDSPAGSKRYRTVVSLGRGGMGTVELAVERVLGEGSSAERIVALKRLLPDAKARHAEMFLREARLAVLLDHPNVVHVYDFGELDGELFMAMEYVEGEPLSRVITSAREKGSPLEPSLVARMLADVCDGLHAAHELVDERGTAMRLVHRDVSPHNIMVAYDGRVKLLDFGVAKVEAEQGLTRTGEVKGKAAYMSPEQAMGDPLDRRSDLYSVGAVLFECLTGRRMWEGTDMEVMRKLALDPTPKLERWAEGISPAMSALFERLVSRSRDDRPATAAEVARELRALSEFGANNVALLMTRLFESDAQSRRAELTRALAGIDSAEANEVRKSLPGLAPTTTSSRARPLLIALATALALSALAASQWRASSPPPPAPLSLSLVPVPVPVPVPRPTVPDPPAQTASAPPDSPPAPPAASAPPPTSAAAPTLRPILRVDPRPSASPMKLDPKPAPSTKPLDVDPHAI